MEKYIYNEQNGLYYELIGDYYYPCLTVQESACIGIWGMRRAKYLREHKKAVYTNLLLTDKLNSHLEEVDRQAEEMFLRLVEHFKETEGISEQLKVNNQMEWIQKMTTIHAQVREIVNNELIFIP